MVNVLPKSSSAAPYALLMGFFFTAEEDFGDTVPAHFERIQFMRGYKKSIGWM